MKVWKQKLAAAVLAGMLLGAGCTEELDPRPPSAELTEEELLEILKHAYIQYQSPDLIQQ